MVVVNISGTVSVDGIQVGTVSGSVDDESLAGPQLVKDKEYYATVNIDTIQVGDGILLFSDKVADPAGPASETDTITGTVSVDGIQVGTVSGSITDNFESGQAPSTGMIQYKARVVARPGATFNVDVTLANNTASAQTVIVELYDHNNTLVASQQVTVNANSTATVTLSATAPATPGTYTWKVQVK